MVYRFLTRQVVSKQKKKKIRINHKDKRKEGNKKNKIKHPGPKKISHLVQFKLHNTEKKMSIANERKERRKKKKQNPKCVRNKIKLKIKEQKYGEDEKMG